MWDVDSSSEKTRSRVNWVQMIKKSKALFQERVSFQCYKMIEEKCNYKG